MGVRLVLADDHPLMLDGLESLCRTEKDFLVLARCSNGRQTIEAVEKYRPDILVLDLRMPLTDGTEVLRELRPKKLATRVVVLTASSDEEEILGAVRLGARGVVLKEMAPRQLIQCVRKVHAGELWLDRKTLTRALDQMLLREETLSDASKILTGREFEIVCLVGLGLRNRQIADRLFISEGTVKVHLHNIFEKLDLDSRLALGRLAQSRGWL